MNDAPDYVGRQVVVPTGEYEIARFTSEGAAHSGQDHTLEDKVVGHVVSRFWAGGWAYNVAVHMDEHERPRVLMLIVPGRDLEGVDSE